MIRILTQPPARRNPERVLKQTYIASVQRKQLSRYKIKKQTQLIEQILGDPMINI